MGFRFSQIRISP